MDAMYHVPSDTTVRQVVVDDDNIRKETPLRMVKETEMPGQQKMSLHEK